MGGLIATIPGGSANYVFAGPTVSVAYAAGQRITGSISAALSTSAGVASGDAGLCHQLNGAGALTNFGPVFLTVEWDTTRVPTTVGASVNGLAAGNYTVGFCVRNNGVQSLDLNDFNQGWVMVTN